MCEVMLQKYILKWEVKRFWSSVFTSFTLY